MKNTSTSAIYIAIITINLAIFAVKTQNWLNSSETYIIEAKEVAVTPTVVPTATPTPTPVFDNEIEQYIYEVFQEDAERGIKMLRECENGELRADAVNWNGDGTWDYGLWQINEIHGYTQEQLADYQFNTDVAHKIFKSRNNSFYYWTCAGSAGDKSYWE